MRDIGVVIVAAGSGSRAGSAEPKQFRWVAGKPMLLHSILAFQARSDVALVVCVLPRDRAGDPPPWIFQCDVDRLLISVGGRERADSVRNGLEDIPEALEFVLVHDAARPFVPADMIERVVVQMRSGVAACPVLPIADTIKQLDSEGYVQRTVDRTLLARAQTPQGFARAALVDAHVRAMRDGLAATDDAALCEAAGFPVRAVLGSELAMKITTEMDFALAEGLAAAAAQ